LVLFLLFLIISATATGTDGEPLNPGIGKIKLFPKDLLQKICDPGRGIGSDFLFLLAQDIKQPAERFFGDVVV
jgi:hypothetical protein